MLTKQEVIAPLPNTQKQTQGGYQNEETKKHGPNERTDKILVKMETSTKLGGEFKTLIISMLSELRGRADELRENFNSLKRGLKSIKRN